MSMWAIETSLPAKSAAPDEGTADRNGVQCKQISNKRGLFVDASQNRRLLSNSLDRDTLIAAGICVGCRAEKATSHSVLLRQNNPGRCARVFRLQVGSTADPAGERLTTHLADRAHVILKKGPMSLRGKDSTGSPWRAHLCSPDRDLGTRHR